MNGQRKHREETWVTLFSETRSERLCEENSNYYHLWATRGAAPGGKSRHYAEAASEKQKAL